MSQAETVVRQVLAAWPGKNPDAMLQWFAPDCVYDNVPEARPLHGHAEVRRWLEMVYQHCWVEPELLNIAVNGEWVLCERLDAHIAVRDEKRMVLPVMGAVRVVQGKVVMWRDYYDRKTVDALGLSAEAMQDNPG